MGARGSQSLPPFLRLHDHSCKYPSPYSRGLPLPAQLARTLSTLSITVQVSVCVCVTACVMLWIAPQVPYAKVYNGGDYIHYPAMALAVTAVVAALSLLPGACGVSHDSKASLIIVSCHMFCSHGNAPTHHSYVYVLYSIVLCCWLSLWGSWLGLPLYSHLPTLGRWVVHNGT